MARDERIEVAVGILAECPAPTADGQAAGGADAAGTPAWRILIARRPLDGVLGGFWEFPGGKREHGESLESCLKREFQEEVGLSVRVTDALPALDYTYDHGRVRLRPYFCERVDPRQTPQALAVSEWRWVGPEELAAYEFPPANAALLGHVVHALARGSSRANGSAAET